jgi:hypothetical protein
MPRPPIRRSLYAVVFDGLFSCSILEAITSNHRYTASILLHSVHQTTSIDRALPVCVICVCRLAERERSLQNAINAVYRFDSDLKNCLLWLTKVEVVLNHHSEVTVDVSKMDEKQLNQIRDAVRVCKIFIIHSKLRSKLIYSFFVVQNHYVVLRRFPQR